MKPFFMKGTTLDTQSHILPDTGYLRIAQVLRIIPVSKTTWWNGVKSGRFPASVKLGPGITTWRVEDIKAYIAQHQPQ